MYVYAHMHIHVYTFIFTSSLFSYEKLEGLGIHVTWQPGIWGVLLSKWPLQLSARAR